ncbi:MAG: hypothetical protein LZF62_310054 [Nitrospira sp.]|nr:MAG: hypothetical protein LZF62_310054 [Nitrospira sp.]
MPSYVIQKQIHTLIQYGLFDEGRLVSFRRNNISFSAWDEDVSTAWRSRYWIAESEVDSTTYINAWKSFQDALTKIVSRSSFVGQAYHTDIGQPYLIKKSDSEMAYYRHSRERGPVPLHFNKEELGALDVLLGDGFIPEAFYLYWNDAVNAVGYAAKLVLMFAAIEILFGKASRTPSDFYATIETVFGLDIKVELYGTPENRGRSGLRQRLVHGDYLGVSDTRNYVEIIHQTIVRYFNQGILRDCCINEGVVGPQRHLFGNLESWQGFIRAQSDAPLNLKSVLAAFSTNENNPDGYEIVPQDERPDNY